MDLKSLYNIAFKGLGQGKHEFEYKIESKFFSLFEGGLVNDGEIDVNVVLEKQSSLLTLWFEINGKVEIPCDRCLDIYKQSIKGKNKIFVKFGDEAFDEGDDVIWVSTNDYQLNIAQLIYEFIILSVPIKHMHPVDKDGKSSCDPEMLEKIDQHTVKEDKESYDSRWEELQKLLDNK